MHNEESEMETTLLRVARIVGFGILTISAYFSFDGFDQSVTGSNPAYSTLATVIGVAMCISISIIQFVLSSRYDQLNLTLKVIGFASYVYSIWTNYLGAKHIMGMSTEVALIVAFFFDVVPEPLISWSFGDAMKGDLFGNLVKTVLGVGASRHQSRPTQTFQPMKMPQNPQQSQSNQPQNRPFSPNQTRPKNGGVRPEFQNKIKHR